jgi:hypothetical protein
MRKATFLLPLFILLGAGCVTAHYHYAVRVPGADAQTPATVEVSWHGGSRTFNVPADDPLRTHGTQVLQVVGSVFIDVPRGFSVRVTRPGYKPWEHHYAYPDEDFFSPQWDVFERTDVVQLESEQSPGDSKLIGGSPVYR